MTEDLNWRRSSLCDTSACVEIAFRKSSHSQTANCVEVAGPFHKSSRSGANGNCVEAGVCSCQERDILVRDSKDPDGSVLRFTAAEWQAFIAGAKDGEFDGE
mgnify:CR=1 FL=1